MSIVRMLNTLAILLITSTSFAISANTEQTISFADIGGVDSGGTGFRTVTNHSGYLISNNLADPGDDTISPVSGGSPQTFILKANGSNVTHFDVTDIKIHAYGSTQVKLTTATQVVFKNANGDTLLNSTFKLTELTELSNSTSAGLADLFGSFSPVAGVSSIEFTVHENAGGEGIRNVSFLSLVVDNVNAQPDTDTTPPVVSSINLKDSPSAGDSSVTYTVTFDESASNVSIDDFTVTTVSGNARGFVNSVSGSSGSTIDVTVGNISGAGTLRLDLNSNTNIVDGDGNGNNNNGYVTSFTGAVHTVDRAAPNLDSAQSSPQDGATSISRSADITVAFSENIKLGAGNITLYNVSAASSEIFSVTTNSDGTTTTPGAGKVSISGSKLYINPASDLAYSTNYAVKIDSGAILDSYNNAFAGISDNTTLNFTTEAAPNAAPTVSGSPSDISVLEDTASNVTLSAVQFADVDNDALTVTLTVNNGTFESLSSAGTLTSRALSSDKKVITLAGSAANINAFLDTASNITYKSATDASGDNQALITITANDGTNNLASNPTVNIDITEVNDAPTLSLGSNISIGGDAAAGNQQVVANFASMSSDGDANAVQSVTSYLVSEQSDANNVVTNVAINTSGQLSYTPALNVNGTATIAVQVQDNGGTANGGVDTSAEKTFTITVDTIKPTVSSVTTSTSASYKENDIIDFVVNVSEALDVTTTSGTPRIALKVGSTTRYASYHNSNGSKTALTFRYTVQAGDNDTDGLELGSMVDTNGGTIQDSSGNSLNVSLANVADLTGIRVDTTQPKVSSLMPPSNKTYTAGETLDFTATLSESVTLNTSAGKPQLNLTIGSKAVALDTSTTTSPTSQLQFSYTVVQGDEDLDGISITSFALNNATLNDTAGNTFDTTLSSVNTDNVLVDTIAPTVSSVSSSKADGTYKVGDEIAIQVTFSENITVTGAPTLTLETGDVDRVVHFTSVSDSVVTFNYTVKTGDVSSDLDYISTTALSLNGGTIKDAAGNDATLTLATPSAANSLAASKALVIDGVAPAIDTAGSSTANGGFGVSATGDLTLKFTEAMQLGTSGTITLVDSNGNVIETFAVDSPKISLSGDTLTINPSADLSAGLRYAIRMDAGFLTDNGGNAFAGFSNNTGFAFTVAPNVELSVDNTTVNEKGGIATLTLSLKDSAGNAVTATNAVTVSINVTGTATGSGTDYSLSDNISSSVAIAAGSASKTFKVTAVDDSVVDDNETVIIDIAAITTNNAVESGTQTVTITLDENDAPVFADLDGTPTFTENGSAVILDANVSVSDTELDALSSNSGNYDGASLIITRSGAANASDVFANTGALSALVQGQNIEYSNVAVGTVTTNSAGTLKLTFNSSATTSIVAGVLQSITYSNSSEAPDTSVTLVWAFNDGIATSAGTNQTVVSITEVNDAPTLDDIKTPVFTSIIEDVSDANNVGVDIATLVVDNSIGDVDGSAVEAIAVTTVDNTNGKWQYTTDNGSSWDDFSVTSDQIVDLTAVARLLDGSLSGANTHKVRFVPNANYNGTSRMTFVAWDKSAGTASGTFDATSKGGTSAFSNTSDTATITITSVNDAPKQLRNSGLSISEGSKGFILKDRFMAEDVDDDSESLTYTVTTLPSHGDLYIDANKDKNPIDSEKLSLNTTFTQKNVNDKMLIYVHDGSETTSDSFVFSLADGGEDNAAPVTGQTFNFTVYPVNDAVSVTTPPANVSVTEDASSSLDLSAITIIDPDSASVTLTIKVDKGSFDTPADGSAVGVTATLSSDGKTITLTGAPSAIDTYLNTVSNLTYTGEANSQGNDQALITISGSDGSSSGQLATVNIDITDVNDAPVINNLNGDQFDYNASAQNFVIVNQNSAVTVTDIDTDTFNGGMLTVSIASGAQTAEDVLAIDDSSTEISLNNGQVEYNQTSVGSYTGGSNGSALTITFNNSATNAIVATVINAIEYDNSQNSAGTAGERVVRFVLTDGEGGTSAHADVTINVSVNTAPTLALADSVEYTENAAATVLDSQATADDADGDNSWQGNGAKLVASVTTNGLAQDSLSIATGGDFSISNGNISYQSTIIGAIEETSGTENDGVVTASDKLTVHLSAANNAIVQSLVRALRYENTSENPSTLNRSVTVELTDALAGTVSDSIIIVIKAVNDAPTITGTPVTTVAQGAAYSFTPIGQDVDSTQLTYSVKQNPQWLTIDENTGKLSGTPSNADVGNNEGIVITVSDGELSTNLAAFNLTVTNVNDAPTITGSPKVQVNEGQLYSFTPEAVDIDGDKLTFTITNKPSWLTIDSDTGTLSGTPGQSNVGTTGEMVMTVSDGTLQASLEAFSVTVINVNDAPSISGQPARSVVEGDRYSFTPSASDIDSQNLTFSITNRPSWASFNPQTGELSGTPTGSDVGVTANVLISVSDGALSDSLAPFNLTVTVRNTAPIADDQAVQVNEDSRVNIVAKASDAQNDSLTLTAQTQPQNGVLSAVENGWIYIPNANFNGQDSFTYVARDEALTSNVATVTITVNPVNDAPTAQDDSLTLNKTANDNYTIAVLGNDADIDGDVLKVEGVTASIGAATVSGATISYQAPDDFTGSVSLSYSVTDGNKGRASAKVNLVIEGNDNTQAPTLTVPADLTVDATALYTKVNLGVASAKDAQGNVLPVALVDSKMVFAPGKHDVYWRTVDSSGLESIELQRLNVNPLISLSKDQIVSEGSTVTVQVLLNGTSPTYPLEIGYTIGGTASFDDHTARSGTVVIDKGTQAEISFDVAADGASEQDETVTVSLSSALNLGNKHQTTITIRESNVAPTLDLNVWQQNETRIKVSQAGGLVTIKAAAKDANKTDTLTVSWSSDLSNLSTEPTQFVFDPTATTLGVHAVKSMVTDNGSPSLNTSETVYVEVVEQLAALNDTDTDGDLIPDSEEGYQDSDGDGIADYLDAINECNVVPAQVNNQTAFLAEGDPGVCLRRGAVSVLSSSGGLQVESGSQTGLVNDTQATNVGGIYDYIAYGLPEQGQNYSLVLPQQLPIPANAVYRKFTQAKGWSDFVEDENNQVFSSAGAIGYCPPPGATQWQPGLTEGHWCVQIVVQDGGPNDADGEANGTVVDPSGVAVYHSDNAKPVANADNASLPWNSSIEIDVLANDSDADNDSLSLSQASAQFGEVTITAQQTLMYVAAEQFVGTDVITYSITDGQGGTAHSQVVVEVMGNRAPVVQGELVTAMHHKATVIDVLANDSDPDGDSLTVSSASATNGKVTIISGEKLSYLSNLGFAGVDTVKYVVSDSQGASSNGTVQIQVIANRLPIAKPDLAQVNAGASINIDVLANDSDADGDTLTIIEASAAQGTVSISQDGVLTYIAKAGFVGVDTITYMLSDGYGNAVAGTVSVTVKASDTNNVKVQNKSSGAVSIWIYLIMLLAVYRKRSTNRFQKW
ncbi:Ig-like domain-containing protein [Pseudoalteromonas sp. PS5]|uniref:Ig-like domain-containing protein n=1 Tax=Pseudoalteromonas sp. PS5 TaxID=1437473 RepID=UPI000FFE84E2|nr:Ig-like domain-containing protein [Pseudoalteromonas sp. PS5]RXF06972.1 tandem-95 repeat protein [Pseudoalteromonas sp. PS5]